MQGDHEFQAGLGYIVKTLPLRKWAWWGTRLESQHFKSQVQENQSELKAPGAQRDLVSCSSGNDWVGASQAPESDAGHLCKKPGTAACVCDPTAGETGRDPWGSVAR